MFGLPTQSLPLVAPAFSDSSGERTVRSHAAGGGRGHVMSGEVCNPCQGSISVGRAACRSTLFQGGRAGEGEVFVGSLNQPLPRTSFLRVRILSACPTLFQGGRSVGSSDEQTLTETNTHRQAHRREIEHKSSQRGNPDTTHHRQTPPRQTDSGRHTKTHARGNKKRRQSQTDRPGHRQTGDQRIMISKHLGCST